MEIKTERLVLRPLGPEYLESTHAYVSDAQNTRLMMFLPNETPAETEEYLRYCAAEWRSDRPRIYEFAVLRDGAHIGHVTLDMEHAPEAAEVAWILRPDCHGHGYATEAARAMMAWARQDLGLTRFIAHCDAENAASQAVMRRLGMRLVDDTGTRKNRGSDEIRRECLYEISIKGTQPMKLWAGRSGGDVDARLSAINNSIGFDSRMYRQDILGSIAHATMLGRQGIISEADSAQIVEGLKGILEDIEAGRLEIDMTCEDIHTFVEATLTQRIGTAGKRLHTARSRNDQVALDIRMYLADVIDHLTALSKDLVAALCDVAEQHTETVMPGYTHLQRAQPVTLGHYLMAYAQMLLRDIDRLKDCKGRTLVLPLGSGALAGTTYPLDRPLVAELLGFNGISMNSLDGVSDRDFALELLADLSILMTHLSRFSEEICLWCSWEFKFLTLADSFSTGSSIMPQKKNPDITELVRGKTGRVYGDLMTLLTAMKALPLAYNKDMQEDKEALFDAIDTVDLSLSVLPPMLRTATFHPENMRKAAAGGFINATDCADYLTRKGVPFRDAYGVTGRLVRYCIEHGKTLETLTLDEYREFSPVFDGDVYAAIDLLTCVSQRDIPGGPAPGRVRETIAATRAAIA